MAKQPLATLDRLRAICLSFPETNERPSHSAPTFFVRDKTTFVMTHVEGHHGNQFPHFWCAAPAGVQALLVETEPDRFFRPPYVGHRGWIGVRLDIAVDWEEIAVICQDAYRTVAPKALVDQLDA